MDMEQMNYHNWENGKRKPATSVVISLPSKYKHVFKELRVIFIGDSFR